MGYLHKLMSAHYPVRTADDSRVTTSMADGAQDDVHNCIEDNDDDQASSRSLTEEDLDGKSAVRAVTVELSVCFSATYHVPVLHFTAHDASESQLQGREAAHRLLEIFSNDLGPGF